MVLVATVARGVNDDRLGALLRLALELGPGVRGLHIQPVARFGRYPGRLEDGLRFTLSDVMAALCRQVPQWLRMDAARSCCGPAVDKVPVPAAEGARKSRQFVASHWRGDDSPRDGGKAALADDFGRFLARAGAEQRFTLSCMAFQDALSLDVERVRGCCIHVVRPDGRMIPFCLHNLTSTEGRMLYPQRLACGEEGHDGI